MKRNARARLFMVLQLILMSLIFAGTSFAADVVSLSVSEPTIIYYTTNGTEATAPSVVQTAPTSFSLRSEPVETEEDKVKNKELKKKLMKKYDIYSDTFTIRLVHTTYGPKGYINLMCKRSPDHVSDAKVSTVGNDNNHSQVKAIVREFLTEEAEFFGITDLDEFREIHYETDERGLTSIRLQRYIDQLPLEDSRIQFFIRSTGEISSVSARLSPAPPELYETVRQETLPETRAREIAEEVLLLLGFNANTDPSIRMHMKARKIAVSTPPYVLWKVDSDWTVLIDAFTGEVLEKYSNIRR